MKISNLFGQTSRNIPADSDVTSNQLLTRAGFIRQIGSGIYATLHLAQRSLQKIEAILREEMNKIGGQEILLPIVHPAELWKASGRWYRIGSELGRFRDKNDREMVLAMTNEEVVAELVRREVQSYKQLPRLIYQIQTKWRDDPRPRAGLIRVREFMMLDSYSLDSGYDGLERQYHAHYQAFMNIFHRVNIPAIAVKSDTGMMGGNVAHEFIYPTSIGEDTIVICDSCGYTANRQVACFYKAPNNSEALKPLKKIKTPSCKTIEQLSKFLNVSKSKTAKAVLFIASIPEIHELTDKFIFAIVRGDMELNQTKLKNIIQARDIRPATEEEVLSIGAVPGFASPINLLITHPYRSGQMHEVIVVIDDAIPSSPNLVAGANLQDYHFQHTNYLRDYQADIIADIAEAKENSSCPKCRSALRLSRGVEVGNIFQLGDYYSEAFGCTFLNADGERQSIVMGSYGIGVGRLLACIAEEHNDEHGLIWPITVAPYQVHLLSLGGKSVPQLHKAANDLYIELDAAGIEVLFDDRDESPGIKFADADLIGLPLRLTISAKTCEQGKVEIKLRNKSEKEYNSTGQGSCDRQIFSGFFIF